MRTKLLSSRGASFGQIDSKPSLHWHREFVEVTLERKERLRLEFSGQTTVESGPQTCWIDDVRIEKVDDVPMRRFLDLRQNLLRNGEFSRKAANGAVDLELSWRCRLARRRRPR